MESILSVKLQFFAENSTGCIMNRFAKDIGTLDNVVANTIKRFLRFLFMILGSLILASIKCPPALLPISCLIIVFALCSKIYAKVSKNMKRVEGVGMAEKKKYLANKILKSFVYSTIANLHTYFSDPRRTIHYSLFPKIERNDWRIFKIARSTFGILVLNASA